MKASRNVAAICWLMDVSEGNERALRDYAIDWGWSYRKTRQFITDLRENTKTEVGKIHRSLGKLVDQNGSKTDQGDQQNQALTPCFGSKTDQNGSSESKSGSETDQGNQQNQGLEADFGSRADQHTKECTSGELLYVSNNYNNNSMSVCQTNLLTDKEEDSIGEIKLPRVYYQSRGYFAKHIAKSVPDWSFDEAWDYFNATQRPVTDDDRDSKNHFFKWLNFVKAKKIEQAKMLQIELDAKKAKIAEEKDLEWEPYTTPTVDAREFMLATYGIDIEATP